MKTHSNNNSRKSSWNQSIFKTPKESVSTDQASEKFLNTNYDYDAESQMYKLIDLK